MSLFRRSRFNILVAIIVAFALYLLVTTLTSMYHIGHRVSSSSLPGLSVYSGQREGLSDLHYNDPSVHELMARMHGHEHEHEDGDGGGGGNARVVKFEDLHAHHDDDTVAKEMTKRVRVLVWVMTSPQNLDKKTVHVRNTWAKRANLVLFMSSRWNGTFPTIGLNVTEGREHLTAKTMQAFRYIYEHHFHDADWFMKTDDDTYVIMENLRYLLSSYNPQDPIYFGLVFKVIVKQGYTSGGAGYVISKEALRRMATEGINNATMCRPDGGAEDVEVGKCLMRLGVKLMPSVDRLGRTRFHCFAPEAHLHGHYPNWFRQYDANGAKNGIGNISDYPISFHYIGPEKMYALEYFVYHLRPFGIISKNQDINIPSSNNASSVNQ